MAVTYFDPEARERPESMPSPFAVPPHPLAVRAAAELRAYVAGLDLALDDPSGGKMFGVLVVEYRGRVGYLRAFSGMLAGSWHADGFVGPVFDGAARAAFWPAAEAELTAMQERIAVLRREPLRAELAAIDARLAAEVVALRELHAARRRDRHAQRAGYASHELDQASRGDAAERRRLLARHAEERAALDDRVRRLDGELDALVTDLRERSRVLLHRLHAGYTFADATGARVTLRELFAPAEPPGGAGDCAGPKLFEHAYRAGLRPLALAEIWLGATPLAGGRHAGTFYPACRGKCGPILAHALRGLPADPPPVFGAAPIPADQPRVVFEDDWLVVVDKPAGLLSVPGRTPDLQDCVLARLRARLPGALVVHRLDLDASGLLLAAKDARTHTALQALFASGAIAKRYAAWLDGSVAGDHGVIELPLRVDIDDRPRQIVDPIHGKRARTEWHVVGRTAARTRVELQPHTGRTHQLRVHAAHPAGLAAPIVGDRLYARTVQPAERLMLHAEALGFTHPHTGERIELVAPAPF